MPAITGFFHGGITVRDMDRSLLFYRDALGLELEFDRLLDAPYLREVLGLDFRDIRAVYLRIPNAPDSFVELLEFRGIERASAATVPSNFGAGHICFYVDDVAAIHARAASMGFAARSADVVQITAGPNSGAASVYLLDPDGYSVELFQRPHRKV